MMIAPALRVSLLFLLTLVCAMHYSFGQAKVVVAQDPASTNERSTILIKWYDKTLLHREGVILYRRVVNESTWQRISKDPITKKRSIDPAALRNDPDLSEFMQLADGYIQSRTTNDLMTYNLMAKSFQNNALANYMGIFAVDNDVVSGRRYEYRVNKIVNGREVLLGISKAIIAGAYTKDAPIDSVTIFQVGKKVALNWVHDTERFYAVNVYRKNLTNGSEEQLNKHPLVLSMVADSTGKIGYPDPMFMEDRNLKESTQYQYQLTGLGFFGDETERSEPVKLFFKDVTPPAAPKALIGKADSMKVHLNWKNVSSSDLAGINIMRSSKSDGPYAPLNAVLLPESVNQFTDSIQVAGPYYYFISAVDTSRNEAHSDLIFVEVQDVIPPARPEQMQISSDTGTLHLTWKKGNEPDLAGYYLYRTVNSHDRSKYVLLNAVPLNDDHFIENLPKNVKNKFFYYIVAVDTSFNRSKPSEFVAASMPDVLAPEKPFIKGVTYGDGLITVNWIQNVDEDLVGYDLYRCDSSRVFTRINVNRLGRETFRFNDRTHEANTDYYYYLQAIDSAGNASVKSNEVFARRVEQRPEDPASASIQLKTRLIKRKNKVQLSWRADVSSDEQPFFGFIVYKGKTENEIRPVTGLLNQTKIVLDLSDSSGESEFYQVRGYFNNKIIYSLTLRNKI